jgi:hemolysin D
VLDSTETGADRDQNTRNLQQCDAEIARRDAQAVRNQRQLFGPDPQIHFNSDIDSALRGREEGVLRTDLAALRSELASLDSKIVTNESQVETLRSTLVAERQLVGTLQKRLEIRENLAQNQWDTMTNVLDAREALDRQMTQIVQHEGQVLQTLATIASLKRDQLASIAKFNEENGRARAAVEAKRDNLAQEVVKASARADRTRITAPVAGVVQDLGVTTVGQVVSPGQQLMTIVPHTAPVEIEALVQNQDIGFVAAGQSAVIKVDTFPFTIYGTLSGRVLNVAHDAVDSQNRSEALPTAESAVQGISADRSAAARTPQTQGLVFPVTLAIDETTMRADGRTIPLTPGMTVTVEVKTSQRRVIQYVLSPILRASSEALHDR